MAAIITNSTILNLIMEHLKKLQVKFIEDSNKKIESHVLEAKGTEGFLCCMYISDSKVAVCALVLSNGIIYQLSVNAEKFFFEQKGSIFHCLVTEYKDQKKIDIHMFDVVYLQDEFLRSLEYALRYEKLLAFISGDLGQFKFYSHKNCPGKVFFHCSKVYDRRYMNVNNISFPCTFFFITKKQFVRTQIKSKEEF